MVPGVVYGLGADPVAVTVEWRSLREALTTDAGLNVLLDLEIDGEEALCIVKDLQRHPIKGNVLHLDFLRVDRDVLVTVDVPIVLHGEALEVDDLDATLGKAGRFVSVESVLPVPFGPSKKTRSKSVGS